MQHIIPCKFKAYLKKLISQRFKQITIFQLQKYLNDIYSFYLTQNRTLQLTKFINQFTDEPEIQKQVIDTFLVESERMKHFFDRTEQFFGDIVQNFQQKQVLDDKFEIFLSDDWLNDKKLQQTLTQKTGLIFDQDNDFFTQLPNIIHLDNNEEYKKSIEQLLQKSSSYDNSTNEIQQQIINILLERKLKHNKMMDILQTYDVENKQKVYQTLFRVWNKEQQVDQVEKYDEFHPRVKPILIRYCPIAAKWKAEIVENQINLFYSQIKQLDIKLIKQSLVGKRFFKKVDDIPMKMFQEIYQIQDESLFQQLKDKKDVQLIPPKKVPQPLVSKIIKPKKMKEQQQQQRSQVFNFKPQKKVQKHHQPQLQKQQIQISQPPQQHIQQPNDLIQQTQKLNHEIKLIKDQTNNKPCLQVLLRQIQLNIIKQKQKQTSQGIKRLKQLIEKYKLDCDVGQLLQKIEDMAIKKQDKIPKITQVRRRVEYINLQQIVFTKKQIELNKQCENASAIMIIGETGVGKSTLLVGLSGYKIVLDPKTKDYQPLDEKIRQKYKVSKSTMSVTRWANVSKIHPQWTMRRDKILLIDTPGLQQNRGIQIDITNNLGTVKLIKTLKKGRIIIVISQKNFGNRWFSGFKRLIKGISKYLIDIKQLRRSITFILTKGLTLDVLLNEFNEFYRSQGFRNMNWNDNQLQFIKLMREKLTKLPRQHQIDNPTKDIYEDLTNSLLDLQQIQYPGQFVSTSFSTQAQIALDNAFIYVKSMINKTFQLGEYQLVRYYLLNLLTLQSIETKKQQYKNIIIKLKQKIKQHVDEFENLLKQFVIYGSIKCLQHAKKLWAQLNSQSARQMYGVIYSNDGYDHVGNDNLIISREQEQYSIVVEKQRMSANNKKQVDSKRSNNNNNIINNDNNDNDNNNYPNNLLTQIVNNYKLQIDKLVADYQTANLLHKDVQYINLEKQTKKLLIYKLEVIKNFINYNKYTETIQLIKQSSKQIQMKIIQMIKQSLQQSQQQQQMDEKQWQLLIKIYMNQFQTDIQSIDKRDQHEKYTQIGQIITKRFLQNNSNNNQRKAILQLINQSHFIQLQGKLQKKCTKYLKNLQTLQNTHYLIKSIIQPQINELAQRLIEEINYFNQQQQKCTKSFDPKLLSLFEAFQCNKQQYYRIVCQVKNTKHYLTNTERKQQSLYKQVQTNLQHHIKNMQKNIEEMLQNPTVKKYQQIKQATQQTFYFLKIIKSKIYQNYKLNSQMTNIKRIQNQCLQKTLTNSQKIISEIQMKIRQRSQRNKITNYEINIRLLIYYFIAELFEKYQYKNMTKEQKLKKKQTKRIIREKLISPIKEVNSADFTSHNDYQKLYKVINYFKQLDDKCIDLGFNLNDFQSILPINSSQQIKTILKTSYQQIIYCYKRQFMHMVQLFFSQHSEKNHLNQTFFIQQGQLFKQFGSGGGDINVDKCETLSLRSLRSLNNNNKSSSSASCSQQEKKMMKNIIGSQQIQSISEKSIHKRTLQQYLNNQNIKKAINYILSYEKIKRIVTQFNQDLPSIKQQKIFQKNINLKKQFISIVQKISNLVEQAKNPTTKVFLTRQNLYSNYREINFLSKILSLVKRQQDSTDFEKTKFELNQMISKQLDNFDQLLKNTQITYKSLSSGVEFDDLRRLLKHKFAKDQNNQRRIVQLLWNIEYRYSHKIIKNYHPQLNKNTQVLLNMAEFKNIVKQSSHKIQINYYQNAFYIKSCYRYFEQLHQKYQQYLKKLSKGVMDYQKQLAEILNQEQKILQLLPEKYKHWKEKQQNKCYKENIMDEIYQKTKQKQKQIEQKYMKIQNTEYKVTQQFKQIYSNMNIENKQKMKSVYIQKSKQRIKKMQDLLHQDHLKLSNEIRLVENQLQFIPKDIQQQIHDQFQNIKTQISKVVNKRTNIVQKNLNQKNFQGVLDELDFAVKMNNIEMISSAGDALERYYRLEKKQLDINNFDMLEKRLQMYSKVYEDKKYALIKEKVLDLVIQHERFVQKIKQEINESNKTLLNRLKNQKTHLADLNKLGRFKISKFVNLKQSVADDLVKSLKIQKNFQKFFMFEEQYQNLVGNLGKELQDYKKSFQAQIQFVRVSYLQPFKKSAGSKNLDPALRTSFQQKIRSLVISKQVCLNLSKLQNKATPIDLQSAINKCVLVLIQLEQVLWQKKCQLEEWSFYQNLRNDTKQRLIQNFSKIIIEAQILNKFIPIINTKNQLKQQQIQANFYSSNESKFKFFQKQIIYIIEQSFINPKTVSGQRVRIYYDFIGVLKQNKINLFKQKIDLGTQVKNLLENKLRQTYNKIQNFAQRKQKQISYQSLLYQFNKTVERQSIDKQALSNQKVKQIKNIEHYYEEQLVRKLNTIVEKDLKLRSQKILQVEKKIEGDKNAMIKQIQSKYRNKEQQLAKDLSRKKIDIQNKMTSFLDENLIKYLIIFQHAKTYYNCEQKISKSKLSLIDLLGKIKKTYPSSFVRDLYVRLLNNQSKFCQDIIQLPNFQAHKENPFIELTKGQNFQSLMLSMPTLAKNDRVMKILSQCYKHFQNQYQEIIGGHRKTCSNESFLSNKIRQARNLADHIKINRKSSNKEDIVKLLAYIFALWTINESIVDEESHEVKYHYKPHPGQILAVFLLLDLNQNADYIPRKKIIQIQTGQGKSIVLGALSAYLALIGFDVYEACFSKYLSERDFESFSKFFYKLGIIKNIKYDIFPQICKSLLDWDQHETFREKVQKYINNSKIHKYQGLFNNFLKILKGSQKKQFNQNKKILLIDEADVFLDQNYLGQSYRPSIRYYTKNVQKFLYFVWSKRDQILDLDSQFFYKSQQFKEVIKEYDYPQFEKIMRNQVHGMMRDLAGYQNDVYTLINRKIYYKQGDGLSDKIRYGYRTLFSYFHEYEINNQINLSDLTPHIAIYFAVASFSYSLLPTYFESILGVSGTLQSMSKKQKQIIKDNFSLDILTLPSIYPKSRRTVKFRQCTNNQLYSQIVKSIEIQHSKRRPILVFFTTKQESYNFFDSQQFSKFKLYKTSIVTYEVEKQNRNFRINQSTDQSNITLLTMDFSRGTDFKIKGNKKEDYQGLHVISASLPQSYSDYMQLIGRTGRQGRNGSVLIFTTSDEAIQVKQIDSIIGQRMIRQRQDKYWKKKSLEITKKMKRSDTQHSKTLQIFKEQDTSIKEILNNIYRLNEQPRISFHKSNTVICIDGTSSMSPVFDKVKQVIDGAMPDIYKAIKASDVDAQFSIKIVIYRNYNSSHNQLLECTNFETKQEPLLNWLNEVKFSGGWGNQAIEVCFQHINSLKNVNQIVLIADAKANSKQQVIEKRQSQHGKGQAYWISNNFPLTCYEKELQQLMKKKIKCHSYYIGKKVKEFFDDLSQKTNGQSKQFMIEQNNATQKFANFVAEKIIDDLKNLVGSDAGKKIMSNYLQISSKRNYI